MPHSPILVPKNDKRNRYDIKLDGLDDQGRLSAPIGSTKVLTPKIFGKNDL